MPRTNLQPLLEHRGWYDPTKAVTGRDKSGTARVEVDPYAAFRGRLFAPGLRVEVTQPSGARQRGTVAGSSLTVGIFAIGNTVAAPAAPVAAQAILDNLAHLNRFLAGTGVEVAGRLNPRNPVPVLRLADGTQRDLNLALVNGKVGVDAAGWHYRLIEVTVDATGSGVPFATAPGAIIGSWRSPFLAGTAQAPKAPSRIRVSGEAAADAGEVSTAPACTSNPLPDLSVSVEVKAPKGFTGLLDRAGEPLFLNDRLVTQWRIVIETRFTKGVKVSPLAVGPTGTGKTEGLIALAKASGLEVAAVVQCGGLVEVSDLYGQTQPDETAPHGWRRFPSALWTAFETAVANPDTRYLVVLDELNRAASLSVQNALLGVLDGSGALHNPATNESISLPANVLVAATANIGSSYAGTVAIDTALHSRLRPTLPFQYLPKAAEVTLYQRLGLSQPDATALANAAHEVRRIHSVEPFRSSYPPGPRECALVCALAQYDPTGVAGAWHDTVVAAFSNEGRDPSRTEYARVRTASEGIFGAATPSS